MNRVNFATKKDNKSAKPNPPTSKSSQHMRVHKILAMHACACACEQTRVRSFCVPPKSPISSLACIASFIFRHTLLTSLYCRTRLKYSCNPTPLTEMFALRYMRFLTSEIRFTKPITHALKSNVGILCSHGDRNEEQRGCMRRLAFYHPSSSKSDIAHTIIRNSAVRCGCISQ